MKKIGAVILNYKNYTETVKCVRSVLEQEDIRLKVVIVDNGSGNESLDTLHNEFRDNNKITILENTENLGYAQGNNVGISFLRKEGYDFILVCNSDVVFSSKRILFDMICNNDSAVGTIIPIIRNLDGTLEMRAQYRSKLFPLRVFRELRRMQDLSDTPLQSTSAPKKEMELLSPGIQDQYYVITGSVFALTPSFFKHYNGLFPETFLYVEELATLLLVYRAGLKCAIAKTDDVIHKGAASTSSNLQAGTKEKRALIAQSAKKVEKLIFLPSILLKRKYGVKNDF